MKWDCRGKIQKLLASLAIAAGCGVAAAFAQQLTAEPESVSRSRARVNAASGEFTLVGAGDIAWCGNLLGAEATTKLIEAIPGTVFAAGDLVYNSGAFEEFQNCYQPTWGKFKDRTKPSPGNHEYNGSGASGYFQYWGKRAGDPATGYYSYDLGRWHILVLNTNCSVKALGGCAEGSPQEVWLGKIWQNTLTLALSPTVTIRCSAAAFFLRMRFIRRCGRFGRIFIGRTRTWFLPGTNTPINDLRPDSRWEA
jgi:hypothetical protein